MPNPISADALTITVDLRDERNRSVHTFIAESIGPFSGNVVIIRYPDKKVDLYSVPEGWTLALTENTSKDVVE